MQQFVKRDLASDFCVCLTSDIRSIDAPTYREEEDIEPPFAVVGSNITIEKEEGKSVRGREYPWGVVDIENKVMIYSVRNPRS